MVGKSHHFIRSWIQSIFSYEFWFVVTLILIRKFDQPRLRIAGLNASPFIYLTLVLLGLALLLIIYTYKNQRMKQINVAGLLVFSAWLSWTIFSLSWAPTTDYGMKKAIRIVLIIGWAYLSGMLLVGLDTIRVKKFLRAWLSVALVIAIFTIIIYVRYGSSAFYGTFGASYLGFGRVIALGLIVLMACILSKDYDLCGFNYIYSSTIFLIMSAALLLSGARGPLIAVTFSVLIGALMLRRMNRLLLFLLLLTSISIPFLRNSYIEARTLNRLLLLVSVEGGGASAQGRLLRWKDALSLLHDSPIIGGGLGSFYYYFGNIDAEADYPHNIFLEVASETGMIGLILFIIVLVFPLIIHKPFTYRRSASLTTLLMLFSATTVFALLSGDIADNRYLFAVLGVLTGFRARSTEHDLR